MAIVIKKVNSDDRYEYVCTDALGRRASEAPVTSPDVV